MQTCELLKQNYMFWVCPAPSLYGEVKQSKNVLNTAGSIKILYTCKIQFAKHVFPSLKRPGGKPKKGTPNYDEVI